MLSPKLQEIIDRIVEERIALLAELIRQGEEPNASIAAEQLSLIGTKQAAETLSELFVELKDETLAFMLLVSPFKDDYKTLIEENLGPEAVAEACAELKDFDPRITSVYSLIEAVAEAIEASTDDTCGDDCARA